MRVHELKPTIKKKHAKRVGRGGKRGTYSGKGQKGQKSRAGARIRPGFRGGDNPIWKLFPKNRGSSKKTEIKSRRFKVFHPKPATVNLKSLDRHFKEGELVSPSSLVKKGVIGKNKNGVKILGEGELNKKLYFTGVGLSETAKSKILKAGGSKM